MAAGQCAGVDMTVKISLLQFATQIVSIVENVRADSMKNANAAASNTDPGIQPSSDFINICAGVP